MQAPGSGIIRGMRRRRAAWVALVMKRPRLLTV
jgi:hypothetical protein